jgi:small-conductance mechanosensitive channel
MNAPLLMDNRFAFWLQPEQWPLWAAVTGQAFLVLLAAVLGYAVAVRGIRTAERHGRLPITVGFALRKVLQWITVVVAVILLLSVFGIFQNVFAAVAGVLTLVAAGFVAFWSVLSNLLCALILLTARPFMLGDRIQFVGDETVGTVADFNLLFTTLRLDDGRLLQVPNNMFFQKMFLRSPSAQPADLAASLESSPQQTTQP